MQQLTIKRLLWSLIPDGIFIHFFGNTGLSLSIKPDGITNECNWNSQTGDITGVAIKQALDSIAANPGL